MICVTLFFEHGLWSAAVSAPSRASASSSSEERASLPKCVSERRGGQEERPKGMVRLPQHGRPLPPAAEGPAGQPRPRRSRAAALAACPAAGWAGHAVGSRLYLPWCRRTAAARAAPPGRRAASFAPAAPRSAPPARRRAPPARPGGAGRRPPARVPWPCSSAAPALPRRGAGGAHGRRHGTAAGGRGGRGSGGGLRERGAPAEAGSGLCTAAGDGEAKRRREGEERRCAGGGGG